jgi:hypothetical protein
MPPLDVLLISSENVPEGYVSLLNGPHLFGMVRSVTYLRILSTIVL